MRLGVYVYSNNNHQEISYLNLMKQAISPDTIQILADIIIGKRSIDAITADDWLPLIHASIVEGVAALLAYKVQHEASTIPPTLKQELLLNSMRVAQRHFIMRQKVSLIADAFEKAGIPLLWLKGMALSYITYPQPTMRSMVDHDIVVPSEYIQEAFDLMTSIGFYHQSPGKDQLLDADDPVILYWNHHYVMVSDDEHRVAVELHNHLLTESEVFLPTVQEKWLWEQTQLVDIKSQQVQTLNNEIMILYLSAHAILHHRTRRLVNYLDLHYLIEHHDIDWDFVLQTAERLKWSWMCSQILEYTQKFLNTNIPQHVLETLANQPAPADHLTKLDEIHKDRNMLQQTWYNLRKAPLLERIRVVWKVIFPSFEHLQELYSLPRSMFVLQYPYHWAKLLQAAFKMRNITARID